MPILQITILQKLISSIIELIESKNTYVKLTIIGA